MTVETSASPTALQVPLNIDWLWFWVAQHCDRECVGFGADSVAIVGGVIAIVAGVRAVYLWNYNRLPRPLVTMCVRNPVGNSPAELAIRIVNSSEKEMNIVDPATLVVDDPGFPPMFVRAFQKHWVADNRTEFPQSLSRQGRIVSRESMSQLADDLRMRDCRDSCLVRGQYLDAEDQLLQTDRYIFSLTHWLEADASARRHNPSGPTRTGTMARLQRWWALKRAHPLTACRERVDGSRDPTVVRPT